MHRLLCNQLAKARTASGGIDLDRLSKLVSDAYLQFEKDRSRSDRATRLMIAEVDALNRERNAALEARAAQSIQLDAALNNMVQGLAMFCAEQRIVVCNNRYAEIYGLTPEQVTPGTSLRQIVEYRIANGFAVGKTADEKLKWMLSRVPYGKSGHYTSQLSDGRYIAVAVRPMSGGGIVTTHEDITERRQIELERNRNKALLDLVIENVPSTIVLKDASDFRYLLVNRAGEQYFGMPRQKMLGRTAHEVLPKESADLVTALDEQALQSNGAPVCNEHVICMPGQVKRVGVSTRLPILDGDGQAQYVLAVVHDVSEQRRNEERILHLAYHDALTDLPNRVFLQERMQQMLAGSRQNGEAVALLCLDLDHFKEVNDTLGHATGDHLLKALSARLNACARDSSIVARLGGDEFAIAIAASDPAQDAAALACRIIESLKTPVVIDGHQLTVATSIGIAVAPDHGSDAEALLQAADLALYNAKGDGRGIFRFFEPEMNTRMQARCAIQTDLRWALEEGQFALHYQPLVDLASNRISGCEALLRWSHPTRGRVSPAEFIPIAEATGLIVPISEWVLREACRTASTWPAEIGVAVNLSAMHFKSSGLVQTILNALAASGLSPGRLELEITESVLLLDGDKTLETLKQLRGLGVRIALDDFGTGYSSLSYLHSFPFDKIKIDRRFVSNITVEAQNALTIVRTIAQLARSLGMATTAEGVETQEQLELVRAEGCTEMQGYLFSPPIQAEAFQQLLLQHNRHCAAA